jgi:hypothetical protein
MPGTSPIAGLVFSRDRAMQLDAALRSFLLHGTDALDIPVTVLYRVTNPPHPRQYAQLIQDYQSFNNITFQPQSHFRQDVLAFLASHACLRSNLSLYYLLAPLPRRLGFLSQPLLRFGETRYILFLVDDDLFVRTFSLTEIVQALELHPLALGYSLRLGRNITYCYTADQPQPQPEFTAIGDNLLCFDWRHADLDFGYPLEVSSSVYRVADLLTLLNRQPFANPNQLEALLAQNRYRFTRYPFLLCPPVSLVFSNPVNQVAERFNNRSGTDHACTSEELSRRFAEGLRVNVVAYDRFLPESCHQEVGLHFYRPNRGLDAA